MSTIFDQLIRSGTLHKPEWFWSNEESVAFCELAALKGGLGAWLGFKLLGVTQRDLFLSMKELRETRAHLRLARDLMRHDSETKPSPPSRGDAGGKE